MQFVVTLIGPAPGTLSAEAVEAALGALNGLGAETGSPKWLAPGEAVDLPFQGLDPDQADAAIRTALGEAKIDLIAQAAEPRRKKMLIADMELTIIEQEMLDEIADLRGLRVAIAAITARAMNGEIEFIDALKERVGLLAGLSEGDIDAMAKRITFMLGAKELVGTMRKNGARAILVSGGFTIFAERVATETGFDKVYANTLEFDGPTGERILTGRVLDPIRDRNDKLARLTEEAGIDRIPLSAVLAVGDGANDLPMLLAAGLGVAFHAKPTVRAAARTRIDHAGLTALLYAQGYSKDEFIF